MGGRPALALVLALAACTAPAAEGPRSGPWPEGFDLGAAITPTHTLRSPRTILAHFTSVTAENAHKWPSVAPGPDAYDWTGADAIVRFARDNGLRLRGHTLAWGRLNGFPKWLRARMKDSGNPARTLEDLLTGHIRTLVGRYRGAVAQWDVVNEPLAPSGTRFDEGNFMIGTLGEAGLVRLFQAAHEADPDAALFLNEIGAERDEARFEALMALVDRLRAAGAPIHGVGLQGHYFTATPDIAKLEARLEAIGERGLLAEITELDLPLATYADRQRPGQAQAEAFAGIVSACLRVEACTGVTVWGLKDTDSWLGPNAKALLLNRRGAPKAAMEAVLSVIRDAAR